MTYHLPEWAKWPAPGNEWTVGVEEEVMLLHPETWELAQAIDRVLEVVPDTLRAQMCSETHSCAVELNTGVHRTVADAIGELGDLRMRLAGVLDGLGLRAGCSGTHPFAVWSDMRVAAAERHQAVYGSMRALARREPTYALHVHVGIPSPAGGAAALNQLRAHVPLLLALSANSPFWQGRDTGLASARTPLFQAFPRVGIPRVFSSYADWVRSVDLLIASGALPDHSYLWWDVRLQPRYGTVESRVMDAQASVEQTAALVALVQSVVRLEVLEGYASARVLHAQEVLDENRFLAARDGVMAELIDPDRGRRVPVAKLAMELVDACEPHAQDLGCAAELGLVRTLVEESGATRQRKLAGEDDDQVGLVEALAEAFSPAPVGAAGRG
jgi:glutamate---cysteine ligase / carboxylate-amine ligase